MNNHEQYREALMEAVLCSKGVTARALRQTIERSVEVGEDPQTPASFVWLGMRPLRRKPWLSDDAISEAIHVCALFNIINRLADAFDFDTTVSTQPKAVAKSAAALLKYGYRI